MPATSKSQQRFMGMVHAVQKGDMKAPSKQVAEAAKSMSKSDAKDFAKTKHKGLPEKKSMSEQDAKSRLKQAVHAYINHLADQAAGPLHLKRAQEERLVKLSAEYDRTGSFWEAVKAIYPDQPDSVRLKFASDFARGLRRYLTKRSMGMGTTSMSAGTMPMAPSTSQTMPFSAGTKMPAL